MEAGAGWNEKIFFAKFCFLLAGVEFFVGRMKDFVWFLRIWIFDFNFFEFWKFLKKMKNQFQKFSTQNQKSKHKHPKTPQNSRKSLNKTPKITAIVHLSKIILQKMFLAIGPVAHKKGYVGVDAWEENWKMESGWIFCVLLGEWLEILKIMEGLCVEFLILGLKFSNFVFSFFQFWFWKTQKNVFDHISFFVREIAKKRHISVDFPLKNPISL